MNCIEFGKKVYLRRMELGMSQSELGDLIGYERGRVSKIESGKSGIPQAKTIMKLSKALKVPVSYFEESTPAYGYLTISTKDLPDEIVGRAYKIKEEKNIPISDAVREAITEYFTKK